MNFKRNFASALVALALGAGALWAASGQTAYPGTGAYTGQGYGTDQQTLAAPNIRSISGTDLLTTAVVLALPEFKVFGRQTLILTGRFSNSAATVGVQIAYVYKSGDQAGSSTATAGAVINTIKEWSMPVTLTAGTTLKEGTYYDSPPVYLDSNAAVTCRVVCTTAPSAGTVVVVLGSE